MGEVRSVQVNVSVEPMLHQIVRDNEANISSYVRLLIVQDLLKRGLLDVEKLVELVA
jgi:hypothetical protein